MRYFKIPFLFCFLYLFVPLQSSAETFSIQFYPDRVGLANETWAIIGVNRLGLDLKPACVTEDVFSWDITTDYGQKLLDMAVAAKASGRRLFIKYDSELCGLRDSTFLVRVMHIL